MKSVNICLDSIDKVKNFVNTVTLMEGDMDLRSNRYVVDAKSIMGIFSLDLSKPLALEVHNDEDYDKAVAALKSFIVE